MIYSLFCFLLFSSCSTEKSGQELLWEVGESQSSVAKIIKETDKEALTLALDGSSFCLGFGVRITVIAESDTIFNQRQDSLPATLTIPLTSIKSNIEVSTSIEANDSGIDCFRLGNVNCRLAY
jgi:hypothetical protein